MNDSVSNSTTIASIGATKDPLVHEIHTTELRSYRGCRRRWDWAFNQNRQPVKMAVPLEFGIAFHRAMEAMYNPETWGAPRTLIAQFAEAAFVDECRRQKSEWEHATDKYGNDDEERDYDKLVTLGRGMIHWYVQNHLPVSEFVVVAVEVSFQVPVLDEVGQQLRCKCRVCHMKWIRSDTSIGVSEEDWDGLPVVYEGRVDAIIRDKWGNHWILDWKTTARMMSEDSDVVLELDDQISGYVFALRKALGLAIRGFKYVELRKAFPEPPTKNKNVRLGKSFSVSKQQATDYDTFVRTVSVEDKVAYDEGLYADYIEWLQIEGTRFIEVHTVYKTEVQLESFHQELIWQAREMTDPNLALYKSPGRFSCGFCAFREPCLDKDQGGDYQYALDTMFEIKPRYYALQAASTDRGMNN
jgi:PD-(D/E)XK nuclease superfamily